MSATVTVKTNKKLKKQAKQFFEDIWLDMWVAINLFLQDTVQNRRFSISLQESPYGTLYDVDPASLSEDLKKATHPDRDRSEYVSYSVSS